MLTMQEKEFFASIAWGASKLSNCDKKHGAVIIRDCYSVPRAGVISYGFNKKLTQNEETSAIVEALITLDLSPSSKENERHFILFTTKFPSFSDMKTLLSTNFSSIYFFGNVDDPDAVRLVNDWNTLYNSLEVIKLE